MINFFISQHSLGYIGPAILALSIAVTIFIRLRRLRRFDPTRMLLGAYFLCAGLFNLLHFVGYSWFSPKAQVVWYIVALTPFAILFMVLFAYRFPRPFDGREPLVVTIVGCLASIAVFGVYVYGAGHSAVIPFGRTWGSEYRSLLIPLLVSGFFLWTVGVLLRQARRAENGSWLKAIFVPETPEGRVARAFALVVLFEAANSGLVALFVGLYPVRETLFTFGMNAILMGIYTLYVLIYLVASYNRIPFIYKLTGIPVVLMLLIVSALGYLVLMQQETTFDEYCHIIAAEQTGRGHFVSALDENIAVTATWAVMRHANGRYERFGDDAPPAELSRWSFIPGGTQLLEKRDVAVDYMIPARRFFLQYRNKNWFQYNVPVENGVIGAGFAYEQYLAFMHRTGLVLLVAELVTWLLLVTILPLLYYIGIIRPLHTVIHYKPQMAGDQASEDEISRIRQLAVSSNRKSSSRPDKLTRAVQNKLEQVELFIRDNYHEDLSREGLASMVNLDPDYMGRLFRMATGEKLGDYINNLRIAEAMELLRTTDTPVIDICYQTGFESLRTFNRAFQRVCSSSPTEWRRHNAAEDGVQR